MRGAGGTPGGTWNFFIGLAMALAGGYLLLSNIMVTHGMHWGYALYRVPFGTSRWGITTGGLLIPLLAGIGVIFYNAKNILGWVLTAGSLGALVFGVLMSLNITMRSMSLLDLLIIFVLLAGGLGLFARSLRSQ